MTKRPYAKTNISELLTIYLTLTAARVALVNEDKRLWKTLNLRTRAIEGELIERGISIPNTIEGAADLFSLATREAGHLHHQHLLTKRMAHSTNLEAI